MAAQQLKRSEIHVRPRELPIKNYNDIENEMVYQYEIIELFRRKM